MARVIPDADELLTVKQVAEMKLLPYHPITIYELIREEKLGCTKLSPRKIRVTRRHIAEFKAAADRPQRTAGTAR